MAHFIVEYSTNLEQRGFVVRPLLAAIVDAAVGTGIFPAAGCRARAHPCDDYFVGDGREEFAFVHLKVRLGAGRSDAEKEKAQQALTDSLVDFLQPWTNNQGLAISFELAELPEHKSNINNLRDHM